jgi:hypothetical protein
MAVPARSVATGFVSADFTRARYAELLALASAHYRFEPFGTGCAEPHVLWRHDLDYSVRLAHRIAEIEAEAGVRATYFFLLGSPYYNLHDATNRRLAKQIVALGHYPGLHFDPMLYDALGSMAQLETLMARERAILADIVGAAIDVVSFHNPALAGVMDVNSAFLAGMRNAYAADIQKNYLYCSDSFGYWRFRPAHQVLTERPSPRLQILTHPVWWADEPAGIRTRIRNCVDDEAARTLRIHDQLLVSGKMLDTIIAQDRLAGFPSPPVEEI